MRSRFSLPLTAFLLTVSVSACASTASHSLVGAASNVPAAVTSQTATPAATSEPVVDATLATVPSAAATTTAAPTTKPAPAATTTTIAAAAHPAVTTHTTAPAPRPTTTRPAPKPTTVAQPPAATCEHHATIDEGTARCGAGEPHPAGTTAECWDGTYSESTSASGTCSHHQGVEVWYY